MHEHRAVNPLLAWLERHQKEKQPLIHALGALAKIEDERVVSPARALLHHEHPHVRHAARETLRLLGV